MISGLKCLCDIEERVLQIASTSHPNEQIVVTGNICVRGGTGIVIQDVYDSIGRTLIANNLIVDCDTGIYVSAAEWSHKGCLVEGNYIAGGAPSTSALLISGGRNIVRNNVIEQVTETITASQQFFAGGPVGCSIGIGTNVVSIPRGTGATKAAKFLVSGLAGERNVSSTQFNLSGQQLLVTVDGAAAASALTSVQGVLRSEQWAYAILVTSDDYHVIENNVIIGDAWTTVAFVAPAWKTWGAIS